MPYEMTALRPRRCAELKSISGGWPTGRVGTGGEVIYKMRPVYFAWRITNEVYSGA
jgi:hypothetical protein